MCLIRCLILRIIMVEGIFDFAGRLNLPDVRLRVVRDAATGGWKVWDVLRRKFVALTAEEYVRQRFTGWMCGELGYPASHVANEVQLVLNNMRKRCDTLVYDRMGRPLMILEFKAPHVVIDQGVFDQIYRYNLSMHARYLTVSNGMNHYCCKIDYAGRCYHFLPCIPKYNDLEHSSEN